MKVLLQPAKRAYARLPGPFRRGLKQLWIWIRGMVWPLPYWVGHLREAVAPAGQGTPPRVLDVLFVMDVLDRGWILEGICREIAQRTPGTVDFYYHQHFYSAAERDPFWPTRPRLPAARNCFFADGPFFAWCLKADPSLSRRRNFVWYTHPRLTLPRRELPFVLNAATHTFVTCSAYARDLVKEGVAPAKVSVALGGADPDLFPPHTRAPDGYVGFVTAYYPRKNPDRIWEIVERMSHRRFLLIGPNWEQHAGFARVAGLPRFEYVQAPYADYPKWYAKMSVFVSVSLVEGGPIPLVEAMMCNVFPVASRTGFAPDVIQDRQNGFLFDPHAPVEEVCRLIDEAFGMTVDVRKTAQRYSWSGFAAEINRHFQTV